MTRKATSANYLVRERLGRGGMGEVYRATQSSAAGERDVALKKLLGSKDLDEQARGRLVVEAQTMFRLQHANVCQVLDLGEGEDGVFIVMEYIRGLDLGALLDLLRRQGKRLPVASAIYFAREVARALDFAHRRTDDHGAPLGLVHGDVTPRNILLSEEGEVKLADFGVAQTLSAVSREVFRGGTPGFVANEVIEGRIDPRADQYSLGITLALALDGAETPAELKLGSLRTTNREVSSDLFDIVSRITDPDPARRFLSAAELERVLSRELARRFPTFTPANLAEIVRSNARPVSETESAVTRVVALDHSYSDRDAAQAPAPGPATRGTQTFIRRPGSSRSAAIPIAMALGVLVLAVGAWWWIWSSRRSSSFRHAVDSPPAQVTDMALATTAADLAPPLDLGTGPSVPAQNVSARKPGFLTVNSTRWGVVYIDGRRAAGETPLYRYPLGVGEHRISILFGDTKSRSPEQRVRISSGKLTTVGFK